MKTTSVYLSGKKQQHFFDNIIHITSEPCMAYYQKVVEITIKYKQQLRNNIIVSHALFRNAL
jgi:hypothetical protein